MRKFILALILVLAPALSMAGDSRWLYMAAADFIPLPATQTFNSSMEGWSANIGYSGSSDRVNSLTIGAAGITSTTINTPACTMTMWSRTLSVSGVVSIRVNGGGWQALHPGVNTWVSDTVALPLGTNFIEIQTVSGYTAQLDDFSFN